MSNFPQFRSRGEVIENQIFPKFKIVHIILGGGARKLWTFPQFETFLVWKAPLSVTNLSVITLNIFS